MPVHEHLFDIAEDTDAFLSAVDSLIARGSDDGRAGLRHNHARANTCGLIAQRVLRVLDSCPVLANP